MADNKSESKNEKSEEPKPKFVAIKIVHGSYVGGRSPEGVAFDQENPAGEGAIVHLDHAKAHAEALDLVKVKKVAEYANK